MNSGKTLRVIVLSPPLENSGGVGTLFKYAIPNFSTDVDVRFIDTRGPKNNPAFSIFNVLGAVVALSAARIRGRVDVVHLNLGAKGSTLRKSILLLYSHFFLRLPNVVQLHSSSFDIFFNKSPKLIKFLIVHVLRKSDRILVLGANWKGYLISIGIPGNIITEFQMGVPDLANGQVTSVLGSRELFSPFPILLFAGAMGERKGLYNLLKAIEATKDLNPHLHVAGSGDVRIWKKQSEDLKIGELVKFHGLISLENVQELLLHSDILVLPSAAEGLPVSVLEGLSAAKIILCTKVGSLTQFLQHDLSCFFLETASAESIVEQLNAILIVHTRDNLTNVRHRARHVWEEHFNVEHTTRTLEKIWKQCDEGII